jgi:hypothetical protein
MPLAHTIVPWLISWLVFYEIWLVSGVWHGGGFEPGESEDICGAVGAELIAEAGVTAPTVVSE